MMLKDYFEEKDSDNWVIEDNKEDYLLSYCYDDFRYYVNCLNHEYSYYSIKKFISFVKPSTYTINHCMEISQDFFNRLMENYGLLNGDFYILNGFFKPIIVIDNQSCECAVEEFKSITLAMLWLYKGYYTTGHNDLYFECEY